MEKLKYSPVEYSLGDIKMRKLHILIVLLIVVMTVTIPVSYIVASKLAQDTVVYGIGFSAQPATVNTEAARATLSTIFNLENRGDTVITFDANIIVWINPVENHSFTGDVEFSVQPVTQEHYYIGNVTVENARAPPHGHAEVPGNFEIVAEDALNVIRSGNFHVAWSTYAVAVTGSYLGWQITTSPAFM